MKKNFIYNLIYQILVLILPLVTMPYISRVLGSSGIGIYSYTYSIAYYFILIAMLGLHNYGNRTIAKDRDNKENLSKSFISIYIFQIITSTIMIILYCFYMIVFAKENKTIAYMQIIFVIATLFDINWFYFGIEKFKLTITRNCIIKILSFILIFLVVKNENDLWKYTLIMSSSTLISNLVLFGFLKKYISFKNIELHAIDIIKHIKPNLVLFLPVIAVSIYKIMDKIMIGSLSEVNEVGFYENAEKIINVPISIISALGTVTLPRVSNMISNKQDEKVKELMRKTMPFILFMTIPMCLGLIAVGRDFSIFFFGEDFEKTGILIQMLSVTIIFLAWGNVIRTQFLIPKEMDKEYVISAFLGAAINFVFNIILIPKFGSIGACYGTIAAEFFVMFYQTIVIRKEIEIVNYLKKSCIFFINGLIMFLIILFLNNITNIKILNVVIQVTIGVILYSILNIKYIFKELKVIKLLKEILKR